MAAANVHFFIQRPPPTNIRLFNVAQMYNNAYIIDSLLKLRKKYQGPVFQSIVS